MAINERDLEKLKKQLEESRAALLQKQREDEAYVKQLEEQYRRLRQELIQSTRTMQQDMAEKLRSLEADMREKYVRHVKDMRAEYQKRLEEIYNLEQAYVQKLNELNSQQRAVLAEIDKKNTRVRFIAQEQEEAFQTAKIAALQKPTDVFFPHRLSQYIQAGERAKHLMEEGLYTLAANDYSNSCMGIQGLVADTEHKVHELENMFLIYNAMAENADLMLTVPWELRDKEGNIVLCLDDAMDMDYWSDGQFSRLTRELEEHKSVAASGVGAWIERNASSAEPLALLLDRQIQRLEAIPRQMSFCISYALSACDCFNHLSSLRDHLVTVLSEQNYVYTGCFFGSRNLSLEESPGEKRYQDYLSDEQCIIPGGMPDYREERCLRFESMVGNACDVYMIPVRTGAAVGYDLRFVSRSRRNESMVRIALERVLSQAVGEVHVAQCVSECRTAQERLFTAEAVQKLSNAEDRDLLALKYCSGL